MKFPGSVVVTDPCNVDAGIVILSGTVKIIPFVKIIFTVK